MEYKMIGVRILHLLCFGNVLGVASLQDPKYNDIYGYGQNMGNIIGAQNMEENRYGSNRHMDHRSHGARGSNVFSDIGGNQAAPDTRGREFIFAFISNFMKPNHLRLAIGASESGITTVTVKVPRFDININRNIHSGRREEIYIPIGAAAVGIGPQNGTILVTANKPVTVQGFNVLIDTNEGFLAIPTHGLGTEYYVGSYDPVPIEKSEFLVSGIHPLTRLRIQTSARLQFNQRWYNSGDTILLTINRMQSVQFQSIDDLTGTRILSDKPVSVMSGATCTLVPTQTYRCDHLVENIPPVHTWGKTFTLLPFLNRTSGYIFRIIAARADTTLDVSGTKTTITKQGGFKEYNQIAPFQVTITSNKPILVLQYAKGLETDSSGDPFMTVVPPLEQYIQGSVTFGTFDVSGNDRIRSYASMSVTSASLFNLNVNNRPAYAAGSGQEIGRLMSFGADRSMALPEGSNTISNPSPDNKFSAIIYGFASGTGYAMPAVYGLRRLLCTEINPNTGDVREFECGNTNNPSVPGPDQPQTGSQGGTNGGTAGNTNVPVGAGFPWFTTSVPYPDPPPAQSGEEKCYSLAILLLSIIAPSTIIFLIMLIIMCGLIYRRTKF